MEFGSGTWQLKPIQVSLLGVKITAATVFSSIPFLCWSNASRAKSYSVAPHAGAILQQPELMGDAGSTHKVAWSVPANEWKRRTHKMKGKSNA